MLTLIFNPSNAPSGPPAAPTSLTATAASPTEIDLGWIDNASNEDGFLIEQSTDGIAFTQIDQVGTDVVFYASVGLGPLTLYYYRVRAFNGSGNSAYSNVASATTPAVLSVPPDKGLKESDGAKGGYLVPDQFGPTGGRWTGEATDPIRWMPAKPARIKKIANAQLMALEDEVFLLECVS